MDPDTEQRRAILETLLHKSSLKQQVFDNTFAAFNDLKEALHELSTEIDEELDEKIDKRIRIEYRDRGKFEAQIQVAGDVLIFTMHTNVFQFHASHPIWNNDYVTSNRDNSYCGVINIFNFLADSFKYNRAEDDGYLIGRIFVNRETNFFVEGKHQNVVRVEQFGQRVLDRPMIMHILETAVGYALGFDMLVPPYEAVKYVSVEQFNTKFENSKLQTGKRMGYDYSVDDI